MKCTAKRTCLYFRYVSQLTLFPSVSKSGKSLHCSFFEIMDYLRCLGKIRFVREFGDGYFLSCEVATPSAVRSPSAVMLFKYAVHFSGLLPDAAYPNFSLHEDIALIVL